jgi:hypothetical protein
MANDRSEDFIAIAGDWPDNRESRADRPDSSRGEPDTRTQAFSMWSGLAALSKLIVGTISYPRPARTRKCPSTWVAGIYSNPHRNRAGELRSLSVTKWDFSALLQLGPDFRIGASGKCTGLCRALCGGEYSIHRRTEQISGQPVRNVVYTQWLRVAETTSPLAECLPADAACTRSTQ